MFMKQNEAGLKQQNIQKKSAELAEVLDRITKVSELLVLVKPISISHAQKANGDEPKPQAAPEQSKPATNSISEVMLWLKRR